MACNCFMAKKRRRTGGANRSGHAAAAATASAFTEQRVRGGRAGGSAGALANLSSSAIASVVPSSRKVKRARQDADRHEHLTRESEGRRRKQRQRLRLKQLQRALDSEKSRLESHMPAEIVAEIEREEEEERWKKKHGLKGAARPASEVYPWLYPEIEEARQAKAAAREASRQNLLANHWGKLFQQPETRKYVQLGFMLAHFHLEAQHTADAIEAFNAVLEQDTDDTLGARAGRAWAYLDDGDVTAALQAYDALMGLPQTGEALDVERLHALPNEFLWNRALLEYIVESGLVDDEERNKDTQTSSSSQSPEADVRTPGVSRARTLLQAAMAANPYVAVALRAHDAFARLIDARFVTEAVWRAREGAFGVPTLATYKGFPLCGLCSGGVCEPESPSEATAWFVANFGMWQDVEGALDWVAQEMLEQAELFETLLEATREEVEVELEDGDETASNSGAGEADVVGSGDDEDGIGRPMSDAIGDASVMARMYWAALQVAEREGRGTAGALDDDESLDEAGKDQT